MVLNLIVALVTLISLFQVLVIDLNKEVNQATREAMKRHGYAGCSLLTLSTLLAVGVGALWTWYAVQVHDWRFAAIFWIPFTFKTVGTLAQRSKVRSAP